MSITEAKVLFLKFWLVPWSIQTNKEIESTQVLKLSKLVISSARYQNPRNMRFLWADQLYFKDDVFSCAMVQLLHLDDETLSTKGISFITLSLSMIT